MFVEVFYRSSLFCRLCIDAVDLLMTLAKTHYDELAKSSYLFPCLSTVKIERLHARRSLLEALAQINGKVEDEALQKDMRNMVSRFH